ncbi:MAG: gliding motility-associated C-terminal domain-containing protein [Bacteroidia bacterium]
MRFLRRILFLLFTLACFQQARASHLMGGEITWTCQGNGQFVFHMKLYRDCNGSTGPPSAMLDVFNHPSLTQIAMNLISQTDISPTCNIIGPNISCAAANNTPGAVEEFIYQSSAITIAGVPPAAGWIFAYQNCCRNNAITNLANPSVAGFTLRAKMFAYNNMNTSPCYDNSPEFLESPKTITCTGYPFTYNHNAVDREADSIVYAWDEPLDVYTTIPSPIYDAQPIPFVAGFSYTSPLPGPSMNPGNVAAVLNTATGEISYTSFTSGNFVSCIRVEGWRCGQKIAEVYRDIQSVLLPCGNNSPPNVTPPFQSNTIFQDTVYAGALVNFTLSATDFDLLPNGQPQTLTINATGSQFGAGFSSTTTGCLNPPCATLTPPPPVSGVQAVNTDFSWQTACNHVNFASQCFTSSNTYNFVIRTTDDFCPAPAQNIATISITVLGYPVVQSPVIHCVAVASNGAVTLTWEQPLDTAGTFNSYHIYSSTSPNGPFTVVDSIFNYNQLSYTHVGSNGNAGPVYYFIKTRSGCGGMVLLNAQDTVSSIFLNVVNNANVTANLSWNNILIPAPTTQYTWFRIYREYPVGNWVLIDSTQSLSYVDSISICNSLVNYRIEIGDSLGCVSVSNIDGDIFQDQTSPAIPALDSVSVSSVNSAFISWQPSTSPDAIGYVLYQYINGIWTAIDTLFGINNTSYTNPISNSGQQSESYVVASLDSCGNISIFSTVHHTLFARKSYDICDATATLYWNSYINFPGGSGGYEIYVSDNGGPFSLLGTTNANDSDFVHAGLTQFHTYCYYIVAYNTTHTITSRSEVVCVFADVPVQPLYNYLRVATVAGSNTVTLKAFVDAAADVPSYNIYRADSLTAGWVLIGNTLANPPATMVTYVDVTPETDRQSYYYEVVPVDSCGVEAPTFNYGRTIFLQAVSNSEITNTISWNDYEQWLGGVLFYNIYRGIDGITDPVPIASVPFTNAGQNIYVDDVSAYNHFIGRFTYQVEGVEGPGNGFGFADTTYSNIAEVMQRPLVFVPNAFTPNGSGLNDFFMPSTGFVDIVDYDFAVFNRWGEKLYETNDLNGAWDGKYAGHKCEPGVYVWLLTFKTADGQYIDQKGTVTLIR